MQERQQLLHSKQPDLPIVSRRRFLGIDRFQRIKFELPEESTPIDTNLERRMVAKGVGIIALLSFGIPLLNQFSRHLPQSRYTLSPLEKTYEVPVPEFDQQSVTPILSGEKNEKGELIALTKEGATAFALSLDAALTKLKPLGLKAPTNEDQMRKLIEQMLPFIRSQGIMTGQWTDNGFAETDGLLIPELGQINGGQFIKAMADCLQHTKILFDQRTYDPTDARYGSPDVVMTAAHELVHFTGNVCGANSSSSEIAAELGAIELLAGMCNQNIATTFLPFLDGLLGITTGFVQAKCFEENNPDWFRDNFVAKSTNAASALKQYAEWYKQIEKVGLDYVKHVMATKEGAMYPYFVGAMQNPHMRTDVLPFQNITRSLTMKSTKELLPKLQTIIATFPYASGLNAA